MFVFVGGWEEADGGAGWVCGCVGRWVGRWEQGGCVGRWCNVLCLSLQAEGRKLTEEEEQQMKELFDEYDTDGSGEISRDELYEIVERVIGSHTSSMHIVDVSTRFHA